MRPRVWVCRSDEESLIDAVSHKAHGVEMVVSRCTSYGSTITLDNFSQADMVRGVLDFIRQSVFRCPGTG